MSLERSVRTPIPYAEVQRRKTPFQRSSVLFFVRQSHSCCTIAKEQMTVAGASRFLKYAGAWLVWIYE